MVLVVQISQDRSEAMVFRAHAPQGLCENLVNALKLLVCQQKDGDSPFNMVVPGFAEESRLKNG